MKHPADSAGDMLYGTKSIAEHLGIRPRQALHLIEQDRLPHFHVGKIICARRSTLTAWIAAQEARGLHRGRGIEADREPERAA